MVRSRLCRSARDHDALSREVLGLRRDLAALQDTNNRAAGLLAADAAGASTPDTTAGVSGQKRLTLHRSQG